MLFFFFFILLIIIFYFLHQLSVLCSNVRKIYLYYTYLYCFVGAVIPNDGGDPRLISRITTNAKVGQGNLM